MSKTSDTGGCVPPSVTAEPTFVPVDQRQEKPCPDCGKTWYSWAPHSCYPVSDIYKIEPNRFDPFEALDTILDQAHCAEEEYHMEKAIAAAHTLRAYITGMER